jgi:hypothetical protein
MSYITDLKVDNDIPIESIRASSFIEASPQFRGNYNVKNIQTLPTEKH